MNLASYIGLLHAGEDVLARSFRQLADGHGDEPDVHHLCHTLAKQCDEHERRLRPIVESRRGPLGLLRDLQDLHALVGFVDTTWTVVRQAALALRDEKLLMVIDACEPQTKLQQDWLSTRLKQAAPQALLVASTVGTDVGTRHPDATPLTPRNG